MTTTQNIVFRMAPAGTTGATLIFTAPSDGTLNVNRVTMSLKNAPGSNQTMAWVLYVERDPDEPSFFYPSLTDGAELFPHAPDQILEHGFEGSALIQTRLYLPFTDMFTGQSVSLSVTTSVDGTTEPFELIGDVDISFRPL